MPRIALSLALVAVLAGGARADEPTTATSLPIDRLSGAKVGDWVAYRSTARASFDKKPEQVSRSLLVLRVVSVDDSTVVLHERTRTDDGQEGDSRPRVVPKGKGLTLERLLGNWWPVSDVREADEARTVGERRFACKRLAWKSQDPLLPDKSVRNRVWLSTEVPCGGVVAREDVEKLEGKLDTTWLFEVVAFGDARGATWGEAPDPALLRDLFEPAAEPAHPAVAEWLALEPATDHEYRASGGPDGAQRVFLNVVEGKPAPGGAPFTAAYFLGMPDADGFPVIDRRDLGSGAGGVTLAGSSHPSWLEVEKGVQWSFSPAVPLLGADLAVGATWSWKGEARATHSRDGARPAAQASATFEVEAQELVTVPAGRFTCVRVRQRWTGPGGVETIRWWAKGAGLVREEQRTAAGGVHVLELVARDVERPQMPGGPRGGRFGAPR